MDAIAGKAAKHQATPGFSYGHSAAQFIVGSAFHFSGPKEGLTVEQLLADPAQLVAQEMGPENLPLFNDLPHDDPSVALDQKRLLAQLRAGVTERVRQGGTGVAFAGLEKVDITSIVRGRLGKNGLDWFHQLPPITQDQLARALMKSNVRLTFPTPPSSPEEWIANQGGNVSDYNKLIPQVQRVAVHQARLNALEQFVAQVMSQVNRTGSAS
jgi:hypothetical protein